MAVTGIGSLGYGRYQEETTYGTGVTSSMTVLPITADSLMTSVVDRIENSNLIGSRLMQAPDLGRTKNSGTIAMNVPPTLIGEWIKMFLGDAVSGSVVDSGYTHYWLAPKTGNSIGKSFTYQQAQGDDTAEQYAGCIITKLTFEGDNSGSIKCTADVISQSQTSGVSRISSWSLPTAIPYNFSFLSLNINPTGVSAFDQLINSFSITLDLGYNLDYFKFGSRNIQEPVFQTMPIATCTMNIDADKQFLTYARAHTDAYLTFTMTSTDLIGVSSVYTTIIELPSCRLDPSTSIPNGNERLSMDLNFDCSYGGDTTNGTAVMWEISHIDGTATHA